MAKYKLIFKVGLCQAGTNVGELLKDISTGRTGLCQAGTNAEKLFKALSTWEGGLRSQENSRSEAGEGMKVSLAA